MANNSICCVDVSQETELDSTSGLVTSDISRLLDADEKNDQLGTGFDFSEDSCRFESECILTCPNLACSISEDHAPQPEYVDVVSSLTATSSANGPSSCLSSDLTFTSQTTAGTACVSVCAGTSINSTILFTSPSSSTSVPVDDGTMKGEQNISSIHCQEGQYLPSHAQPVVIGNAGAASFVKSVLKDLKTAETVETSPQSFKLETAATLPAGYVLLNKPTIVPGLVSMVQTRPETVAAPMVIQLAQDILPPAPSVSSSAEPDVGLAPTANTMPLLYHVQSGGIRTATVFDSKANTQQAVVISCVNPSTRYGKGMQQILNHFLQQNNRCQEKSHSDQLEELHKSALESGDGSEDSGNQVESEHQPVDVGTRRVTHAGRGSFTVANIPVTTQSNNRDATEQSMTHSPGKTSSQSIKTAASKPTSQLISTVSTSGQPAATVTNASRSVYPTTSTLSSCQPHSSSQNILRGDIISADWSEFPVQGNNPLVLIVKEVCCHRNSELSGTSVSDTSATCTPSQSGKTFVSSSTLCDMDFDHSAGVVVSDNQLDDEVDGGFGGDAASSATENFEVLQCSARSTSPSRWSKEQPTLRLLKEQSTSSTQVPEGEPFAQGTTATSNTNNLTFSQGQIESEAGEASVQLKGAETVGESLCEEVVRPIIICIVREDGSTKEVNISAAESKSPNGQLKKSHDFHITASTEPTPGDTESSDGGITHPNQPVSSQKPTTLSHQGPKPKQYSCDLCTATFSRLGNYTRHRKIHTLNLKGDKCYKCPNCDRSFLQHCDMKRHLLIHTKQEPFQCKTCGKGYIRKSDLVVHERFHSKDRAFKCEECDRRFYQSGDLRRHKRSVHAEQTQLTCGHCQRKYAREITLIRHMKTAHNDLLQNMSHDSEKISGST